MTRLSDISQTITRPRPLRASEYLWMRQGSYMPLYLFGEYIHFDTILYVLWTCCRHRCHRTTSVPSDETKIRHRHSGNSVQLVFFLSDQWILPLYGSAHNLCKTIRFYSFVWFWGLCKLSKYRENGDCVTCIWPPLDDTTC